MKDTIKPIPRLKDVRKRMHKTQAELANYLTTEKGVYISRSTIAKYESGINFPSKRTLKKLSNALNISEDYLAGKGMQIEDISDAILDLLQTAYFDNTDQLHNLVLDYLDDACHNVNWLKDFYHSNLSDTLTFSKNTKYPRTIQGDRFWQENFSFLFTNQEFTDTLVGTSNYNFKVKIISEIITSEIITKYSENKGIYHLYVISEQIDDFKEEVQKHKFILIKV